MNKLLLGGFGVVGLLFGGGVTAQTYIDGQTAVVTPGVFTFGSHRPSHISGMFTFGTAAEGTALDGNAVFFADVHSTADSLRNARSDPFNLLVWDFESAYDSIRVYNHPDNAYLTSELWAEYMQLSVWGCNGVNAADCTNASDWVLLSDATGFDTASGKPIYTFAGTAPTTIYRGGSGEFGMANAYTQDYTYATAYNFYGVRASTLAMQYDITAPEVDALAAFNRTAFLARVAEIPEPATLALAGLGLVAFVLVRRRRR